MINIKQRLFNVVLLFMCIISLVACWATKQDATIKQAVLQKPVEIAILMPVTSKNYISLGYQYNQLIKMGLEDGLKTYVHVTSYNGSNEKHILAAMDKIITRKTKIILGPIDSNLTSLISNKAKANNIIIITMSNNPALADNKLFVFGHAPFKQLTRIINYFGDNNYKDFIALLPAGQHSQAVNQIIQNILIQKNATLLRSEFYSNELNSIEKSVSIVSNNIDNLNEMSDRLTKPVIYLAGEQEVLNLVFNNIKKYNLDKKAIIIGDNKINIDYPEDININCTGSLNILSKKIVKRATNLGINHLSFMHIMAYDLGKMTASYIGSKFSSAQFIAKMNNDKDPYIGVSGNIYFVDSIAQREYDILKIENGIYSTLSHKKSN